MRDRKSFGPKEWSEAVISVVATEKEINDHQQVNAEIVRGWLETIDASQESNRKIILEILRGK